MWALRDADLKKPRAAMPAAMLPCPSPAGPDWSFQNPVGVDCSSPEPRCIWLAVLRGATSSVQRATPPAMPAEHGQKRLHPGVRRGPPLGAVRVALSLQLKENRNTIFKFFFFFVVPSQGNDFSDSFIVWLFYFRKCSPVIDQCVDRLIDLMVQSHVGRKDKSSSCALLTQIIGAYFCGSSEAPRPLGERCVG